MNPTPPPKPRVFVDADVLFAGAASPSAHSASLVILQLAEITLIKAMTSRQVITEVERNLEAKLPQTLPIFHLLVNRSLDIVPDPRPDDLIAYDGAADDKDLSILVAAVQAHCPWLVTFNLRHFQPGHHEVTVLQPGDFVQRIRERLTTL
jgi:predicted nucleic acid-binding protein